MCHWSGLLVRYSARAADAGKFSRDRQTEFEYVSLIASTSIVISLFYMRMMSSQPFLSVVLISRLFQDNRYKNVCKISPFLLHTVIHKLCCIIEILIIE